MAMKSIFRIAFVAVMLCAQSVFAVDYRVSREEFESAMKTANFTSSYRMQLSMGGQSIVSVNGFSENEEDEAFYSFNVVLDNLVAMTLGSYFGGRVDGRYSVKAKRIRRLREAKDDIEFRKGIKEAEILVKAPGYAEYMPASGFMGAMLEKFEDMPASSEIGSNHKRMDSMLNFDEFVFENNRYTKIISSSDMNLSGRLSISFADGKLSSVFFDGEIIPDMGDFSIDIGPLDTKVQIKYAKIGVTKISNR